jgi:PhzF family phenazine biosynthesis protein
MNLPIYHIDAFASEVFNGNYAAVIPLERWLPPSLMQAIASENNLSETAFFVQNAEGVFDIRWFSPLTEIAFCGHATLASAYVLFEQSKDRDVLVFDCPATGRISVARRENGLIEMRFPVRTVEPLLDVPSALTTGLSIQPKEMWISQQAYIAIFENETEVRAVVPDLTLLAKLAPRDVVVTSPGDHCDFVSRYFWPANGGDEDPVTGSIHAALAPLWATRLDKMALFAVQVSRRTGQLHCAVSGDKVFVSGAAVEYLRGTIDVPDALAVFV